MLLISKYVHSFLSNKQNHLTIPTLSRQVYKWQLCIQLIGHRSSTWVRQIIVQTGWFQYKVTSRRSGFFCYGSLCQTKFVCNWLKFWVYLWVYLSLWQTFVNFSLYSMMWHVKISRHGRMSCGKKIVLT